MHVAEVFEVLIPIIGITNLVFLLLLIVQVMWYAIVVRPEMRQWRNVIQYFLDMNSQLTATTIKLGNGKTEERPLSFCAVMSNVRRAYEGVSMEE